MKILNESDLIKLNQVVNSPKGDFQSLRYLLEKDSMGFTVTRTKIPQGGPYNWHYKNHLEACLCVDGQGFVAKKGEEAIEIVEGTMYVLDGHEDHEFTAITDVELVCVFNPPLIGGEVHGEDNSYDVGFRSPVYNVKAVPIEKVKANDYNPNAVAPPEMELLETSIWEDGYTQPVVTYYDSENDTYIVVDGFHRYLTLKNSKRIYERERGLLPVVVINKEIGDRMASTIRHNRARGTHSIDLMSNIVAELVEMGKGDAWICKHIGMSKDELLRLKQITGVAALFKNEDFSKAWDVELGE
jgi:quercetin dioxygenase-like cupin family protein